MKMPRVVRFAAAGIALTGASAVISLAAGPIQKQPERPADLAHDKNLYVVGYAHLDTQWRWTYPEVIRDYIRNTMEQNFPLFEKYPDYVFNFTGSRRYEFMKEYYPADYERVKQYVAAGRWFPAGSSVDECDANVPALESLVRHFLYGNRFFQHEFGIQSDEFMLPDCFGFPASLPTILAHGGIKGFSTQKLTWGSAVGIPFSIGTWIGPDGSSVVAALNPLSYGGSVTNDLSESEMWLNRIDATGGASGVYADYHYFGTGDRGGAPSDASVQWIERSLAGNGPVRVISARSDRMFQDITPSLAAHLPSYRGELELTNHSAGSITSEASMKRWNRKNEQLANAAESAATAAFWLGAFPYPTDVLYHAWDLVLGSQMHDILPGTSVPKAYEYSWNDELLAQNQFATVTEQATAAVVSALDTQAQGTPVAVYNPLAQEREDPVEASIPFFGPSPRSLTAYDPKGQPVPTQILARNRGTIRILFLARVPSVGYAIYDVRPGATEPPPSALRVSDHELENGRYRVTLNADGDIASLYDKSLRREMMAAAARLSFHTENPSHYPAWNMDWADRQRPARGYVSGRAKIRIVESGPARVAIEVARITENSTFIQQIRLAAGSAGDRVEVLNRIDWRASEASLKADFPLAAANPEASYDDKVGVVRRDNDNPKRFEVPLQQWMDLTDQKEGYGVAILNDSKYGADKPDDHTLRLTLLYTPGVRGGVPDQGTQDQGRHEILYALAPHRGDWIAGRAPWQAARLNQPLRAFLPTAHSGPLGRTFSLLSLSSDQAQVVAIKKAEDSDEIVVRVKELTGRPAAGLVLRFSGAIASAREIDAQERPIRGASVKDGALMFDIRAFGLRAFALQLGGPLTRVPAVVSQPVGLPFDLDTVSSRRRRTDGAMDPDGGAYPAELFPARLQRGGVEFQLGPTADGADNALAARAQHIALPAGDFNRVHLLVAALGDAEGRIKVGSKVEALAVPNWTGFIGQWDNRIWNPAGDVIGLAAGYTKRTPVAWFATHHNTPAGDAFYDFSYLFQASYDLPPGAKDVTLPDNPNIRVFALSVSREPSATPTAAPLYDTLADHQPGGEALIPQAGQTFHDSTEITLEPPLYYRPGDLRYTLDGSDPTAASAVYSRPFFAAASVNIAVRQIYPDGRAGPTTRGVVEVDDQTPPRLTDLLATKAQNAVELTFSEPLSRATVVELKNYLVQPSLAPAQAIPSSDGRGVTIVFAQPLAAGTPYTLTLSGLRDQSPRGNLMERMTQPFNAQNIVYRLNSADLRRGPVMTTVPDLPTSKSASWTMNLFVKAEIAPKAGVLIAGFGQAADDLEANGTSRYFAVFPDGIRFWIAGSDLRTNSPFDPARWQMLTATYNGKTLALYKDAELISKKDLAFSSDNDASVGVGVIDPWDRRRRFEGSVQSFTLRRVALSGYEISALFDESKPPQ
jgi:alpha-mannosidase